MEPVTEINPSRVKNFVSRHKVAITVVATSIAWYGINRLALKQHEDFLRDHDLLDEYYTPEDEY